MTGPVLHFLNADFDVSLRARRSGVGPLDRQARELTILALLAAADGDAVLLRSEIPDDFPAYLQDRGVPRARIVTAPPSSGFALRPFGWNREAVDLNRRSFSPVRHPHLDCVRRVNARSFGLALERQLSSAPGRGITIRALEELEAHLGGAMPDSEWMLKSEHGNAGMGNRRVVAPSATEADRSFVAGHLAEDGVLVVEPFDQRVADRSYVLDVPFDPESFFCYETTVASGGGLVGALFDPRGPRDTPVEALRSAARKIADRLEREGYFGSVCADAYAWNRNGVVEWRTLVDLNARLALSDPVRRLWRRLSPDGCLAFRFFTRDRLRLPETIGDTVTALGDLDFDPTRRRGILLGSPPRLGPRSRERPLRQSVLCFGTDREDALSLQDDFANRFAH